MDHTYRISNDIILGVMYMGDVVFAMSGAMTAGKHKMDIIGYLLLGVITGIGGGTIRDTILGREVWWTEKPLELILCACAALFAYFVIGNHKVRARSIVWLDALGLCSFAVVGTHVALGYGAPFIVAVFRGMITSTGGGVIRDVITGVRPMIFSAGELYATAALGGSLVYASCVHYAVPEPWPQVLGFLAVLLLRGSAILYGVSMGPPGEFITWKGKK